MGHSQDEKARTRERILGVASTRFREAGLDGLSIADLMKGAGLTQGGFYKHFESREDLIANVVDQAMTETLEGPAASLPSLIDNYLSEAHRDARGGGCAISALAADVGRAGAGCRAVFTKHLRESLHRLSGLDSAAGDGGAEQAMFRLSAMVGALILARAVDDPGLSGAVMDATRERLKPPVHAASPRGRSRAAGGRRP